MIYYTIRAIQPGDTGAVFALQAAYAREFPGAVVLPGEYYLSPAFQEGANVFCALSGERLLAYAPLYLQPDEGGQVGQPQVAWIEIKADPSLTEAEAVKDALGEQIAARLKAVAGGPVRLTCEYRLNEQPAVRYVLSRGFARTESVYHMRRDLAAPLTDVPSPVGIEIRRWKMETVEEQRAYVAARSACFSEVPIALEAWQYYMSSPMWAAGTAVAAFDGGTLVGAVNVYWSEEENASLPPEQSLGYTEDVFVLPGWRGRGIAGAMIVEGMRYLKEHGISTACLAVRAVNVNALSLYRSLGYSLEAESRFYARIVDPSAQGGFSWKP